MKDGQMFPSLTNDPASNIYLLQELLLELIVFAILIFLLTLFIFLEVHFDLVSLSVFGLNHSVYANKQNLLIYFLNMINQNMNQDLLICVFKNMTLIKLYFILFKKIKLNN